MRAAVTALLAVIAVALAATTLTHTALLADRLLVTEVLPAAAALTGGGLWLAVGELLIPRA